MDRSKRAEYMRNYQRKWVAARRRRFFANKCCAECGAKNNLELHHIDRKTKLSHNVWSWSAVRQSAELAKCKILCKKCHLAKTIEQLRTEVVHGTLNGYLHKKCRCAECTAVHSVRMRDWKERTNYQYGK